jgi:thiaminase (transcriptional activator TenA)
MSEVLTLGVQDSASTPARSLSSQLRELGIITWRAATEHPMVREIGAGSLPHDRFRWYFEQNVLYLEDYARAIGLILGKAPDGQALDVLARFAAQIVHNELPANRAFLQRLGGDVDRIDPLTSLHPVAYAYTRHILQVAGQGTCAEGLTAVLPCQWSYGELAVHLAQHVPDDAVYADWIGMFANDAYDRLVIESTALLDRLAAPADATQQRRLESIFNTSVRYEVEFWDMAYSGPSVSTDKG